MINIPPTLAITGQQSKHCEGGILLAICICEAEMLSIWEILLLGVYCEIVAGPTMGRPTLSFSIFQIQS